MFFLIALVLYVFFTTFNINIVETNSKLVSIFAFMSIYISIKREVVSSSKFSFDFNFNFSLDSNFD